MTALLWQTGVILLVAYFLGCWIGCLIRRTLFAGRSADVAVPAMAGAVPLPATDRFEQALSGQTAPTPPKPAPVPEPTPVVHAAPSESAPVIEKLPPPNVGTAAALAAAAAAASMPRTQLPPQPGQPLPQAGGNFGQASVSAPLAQAVAPTGPVDDLSDIRGVDAALASALGKFGVTSFGQIAAWKTIDVASVAKELGLKKGTIERENWIEQAQILAKGGKTAFAAARRGGAVQVAAPTPDEGERLNLTAAAAPATPEAPAPAPAAAPTVSPPAVGLAPAALTAPRPSIGVARDNLKRIGGINQEVERLLHVQGVTRYQHIAQWQPSDIERFDRLLGFDGRIARENWIEQAQILSRGGDTAYSREVDRRSTEQLRPTKLAEAIKVASEDKSGVSKLRSVRSEAYRSPEAGARPGVVEDLKRIRGVGVLIEKRLQALGVSSYAQIANWTADDIQRFSDKLDFKGRIERENWVEQARILASGGQTEFSRRVDRGEVETSKSKPE
jgi:predicted flap endonuclease-1-like 5' DNA nuclease